LTFVFGASSSVICPLIEFENPEVILKRSIATRNVLRTRSKFRAWVELLQRVEEDLAATKQEVEGRREMEQLRKQREKRGRRSKWKERR